MSLPSLNKVITITYYYYYKCTKLTLIVWIHWDFTINAVHALQNTKKNYFGFKNASSKVHFRSTEGQTFYWSIMTVDDSIKCRFANSGVTDQVGGFQNPGVCLQAFPSFLPHPLPALLLAPLFSRSLTLVPRSFRLNRTETLATQARWHTNSHSCTRGWWRRKRSGKSCTGPYNQH